MEHNKGAIIKYGVKRLILFGSYAKNSQYANSDIDFIV
ncbi:nucleotidyltransferase domain-containing protein [Candidatus Woesearchaeota archaeon]|nr:nucleotidyltransferase domain-containing protein [Candidatus Woesearchaeota archaeon]